MNRQDLQLLSSTRRREAKALLDNGSFAGSYYLMGYSVECAIKACIAKQTQRYEFPDKQRANQSFQHDLTALLQTAGLSGALKTATAASPALSDNWAVAKDWSEQSRYTLSTTEAQARDLYSACAARTHGLLPWLKKYW